MRLLLLHKYGRKAASFRYRLEQYIPYLATAGFECTVSPLLDDDYLEERFRTGRRALVATAKGAARRLRALATATRFDAVVLCSEILPYFPAIFERYLNWRAVPYVFDYDDAIFHYYDRSCSRLVRACLKNKIRQVIRGAFCVFAGNPYLVEYARGANPDVELLPTVIDLDRYRHTKTARSASFVIGWIGSPSTASYLEAIAPALRRFCATHNARVLLVGSGKIDLPGIPLEIRNWDEQRETKDILEFDVGIMPLPDDPWTRGKCGFKLVQYMACGLPVIASPVGVNVDIVDERCGLLASTTGAWIAALKRLYDDIDFRMRLGLEGRVRVERTYCVQATAPRFVAGVQRAVSRKGASGIDRSELAGLHRP